MQKRKGPIMQGCVDMIYQQKYTKYPDVRQSHQGKNDPNIRLELGYKKTSQSKYSSQITRQL